MIKTKHEALTSNAVEPADGQGFLVAVAIGAILLVGLVLGYGFIAADTYRNNSGWGDFVGGLLNPILTCATFIAVLGTIAIQRKELTLTRDEMRRSADALEAQQSALKFQNFETTFFEMLKLHNEIVNSIDLYNSNTKMVKSGRDCFDIFVDRLTAYYGKRAGSIEKAYNDFWDELHSELGHYFRFLFNFIKMVSSSEDSRSYHMKLIRSQLSDSELVVLFYNSLSSQGEKFQQLAADHALFDNLSVGKLLDPQHVLCLDRKAYGENAQALKLFDELKSSASKAE